MTREPTVQEMLDALRLAYTALERSTPRSGDWTWVNDTVLPGIKVILDAPRPEEPTKVREQLTEALRGRDVEYDIVRGALHALADEAGRDVATLVWEARVRQLLISKTISKPKGSRG